MLYSHCISGNVERVTLYKTAFQTAKNGVLDCQKACDGNRECSDYALYRHFGNLKRPFWQPRTFLFIKIVVRYCR